MKKLLALVMTLIMTLAFTAALAVEPAEILGVWYLERLEMAGEAIDAAMLGMEITVELFEDGTAAMSMPGEEPLAGSWRISGEQIFVDAAGDELPFVLADGYLVANDEEEGYAMVFGRDATEVIALAPVREDAVLEDFNGNWTATVVEADGIRAPSAMMGFEVTVWIENGHVAMTAMEETIELDGEVSESVLFAANDEQSLLFFLLEDGMMGCGFAENIIVYFEK